MTAHEFEVSSLVSSTPTNIDEQDEYSVPLDISDIINICREYTKLTWQMQNQIESILDIGVEDAIKSGLVQRISLPHIKDFLLRICDNAYFGDATIQAKECIFLIDEFYSKSLTTFNNKLLS